MKKERATSKKRLTELEKNVSSLEDQVCDLREYNAICRKAYKKEKRAKEYLEEVIDAMDEPQKSQGKSENTQMEPQQRKGRM